MLEVVCAVIERDGRILLCQRAAGTHLAGWWEFPGGKVDPGEEWREALEREVWEELGCRVAAEEELGAVEHRYPEVAIRLRPFRCRVVEGEPRALEHADLHWVEGSALATYELAPADVKVARLV